MDDSRMQVADLSAEKLEKLQALEKELGTYIVALEPQVPLAMLEEDQVQKLQQLEVELGVVLLAYRPGAKQGKARP